ncbi:MAG: aspartate carbamoyltransferase, partial [Methylobacter sp.]
MMKRLIASLSAALLIAASAQAVEKAGDARLDEIAQRGSHVMPFNLEQTTHIFSKTEKGGLQQVIAKDSSNVEQIKLIREHLS